MAAAVDDVTSTNFETITSFVMREHKDQEMVVFLQAMQVSQLLRRVGRFKFHIDCSDVQRLFWEQNPTLAVGSMTESDGSTTPKPPPPPPLFFK